MDPAQMDNVTLDQAVRRASLLAAAAEVSQNITHILDIEELLPKTVDIICNAYGFYYAGVFLIDEAVCRKLPFCWVPSSALPTVKCSWMMKPGKNWH